MKHIFKNKLLFLTVIVLGVLLFDNLSLAEPIISTDATNGEVIPGQTLQVELSWPGKTIIKALVNWPGVMSDDITAFVINEDTGNIFEITVPNVQPGPFGIVALVHASDGSTEIASIELEVIDSQPYDSIQADPDRFILHGLTPRLLTIYGVYSDGITRDLSSSSRLEIESSDTNIVAFTPEGLLHATGIGKTKLIATYDNLYNVEIPITVRGLLVEISVNPPSTPPSINQDNESPVILALLSSLSFTPHEIILETIRIENKAPLPFDNGELMQLTDVNGDGKPDLLVQISPTELDLSQETVEISLSAVVQGGMFVAGKGFAYVLDGNTLIVPDLLGMSEADAEAAITTAGLVVGNKSPSLQTNEKYGNVIDQNPAAGAEVPEGFAVDLEFSVIIEQTVVPDVVGMEQSSAESAIIANDLNLGTITTQYSDTVPTRFVVSQNPPPDTTVDVGTSVNLVVSLGPETTSVPNVIGLSQADAEAAIIAAGLIVGTVTTENSSTVPAGDVISQEPPPGAIVPEGIQLNLVVSLGPEMIIEPPQNVQAIPEDGQVTITWDHVSGATSYNIYWNTTGNVTTADSQISGALSPYSHTNLTNGTTYYYIVTAVDADGESVPSSDASATPSGPVSTIIDTLPQDSSLATAGALAQGGTFVATGTNLAEFTINVTMGIESAARPIVLGTTQSGEPTLGPVLWEGPDVITPFFGEITFYPNVPLTVGELYFIGLDYGFLTSVVGEVILLGGRTDDPIPDGHAWRAFSSGWDPFSPGVDIAARIVMNSAPVLVTVPNVVGLSQADAETAITNVGLVIGDIAPELIGNEHYGEVISQIPPAGSVVPEGNTVELMFSVVRIMYADRVTRIYRGDTSIGNFPGFYGGASSEASPVELTQSEAELAVLGIPDDVYLSLPGDEINKPTPPGNAWPWLYLEVGFPQDFDCNSKIIFTEIEANLESALIWIWSSNGGFFNPKITRGSNDTIIFDLSPYAAQLEPSLGSSFSKIGIGGRDLFGASQGFDLDAIGIESVLPPPGQLDADGDGVMDNLDLCPDTPAGASVDENGCWTGQLDSDGDRIMDDLDQCPDTPAGAAVDVDGCSSGQLDSDWDGVMDDVDQCPDTPPGVMVDSAGCELTVVPDVVGLSLSEAGATIVNANLNIGKVRIGESNTIEIGKAMDQNPLGGTEVSIGTQVDLVISYSESYQEKGWRRTNYDLGGTSYYPFASATNSGRLGLLWEVPEMSNAAVLTVDLNNDDILDIVASDGSSLNAYDGQGNVLWSVNTSAMLQYIGDIDADLQPEIFVSYKDGNNHLKVDVYNADGTLDKTLDRGPSGYDSYMSILTHDVDNLIVGYGAGYSLSPRGVGILRYSWGGEDAYFATGGGGLWGTFGMGDSDNDGLLEIALPWGTPHNGASANGTTDGDLYGVLLEVDTSVSPSTLSSQFMKPISAWNPSINPNGYDSAMMPDLDGNGISEILFLEGHDSTYYIGSNYVYNVSPDGTLISSWQGPYNGWFPLGTLINDINSDGIKELVMSARNNETVSIISGSTFTSTSVNTCSDTGRVLGATDIDGDGQDEIIVHQSNSGNIRVLNTGDLTEISSWNIGSFSPITFDRLNRFVISDVTGDGNLELILGAGDGLYILGTGQGIDGCPEDPDKTQQGICGCGVSDVDTDCDSVPDCIDLCPGTPPDEPISANGCSTGQDIDGDGIPNDIDQCQNTPAGENVDENGCSASQRDSDGDGVIDDMDQCSDTPFGAAVNTDGCSLGQLDGDGDGIMDDVDQCPETPPGSAVDVNGCPLTVVPDVIGLPLQNALDALDDAGLTPGDISPQCVNTITATGVLSQSHAAGTEVPMGTSVDLTIPVRLPEGTIPATLIPVERIGDTQVFMADLSQSGLTHLGSITIVDDGTPFGGAAGIFSGFDVDTIFLDADGDLLTSADRYYATNYLFEAGTTRETEDPAMMPNSAHPGPTFGSLDPKTIDHVTATLDQFDATNIADVDIADGALTLGDGGTLTVDFSPEVPINDSLFLIVGEVGGQSGERLVNACIGVSDQPQAGAITITKEADPAEGTEFSFNGSMGLGDFILDYADPDDADEFVESRTFTSLTPGVYTIIENATVEWGIDNVICTGGDNETFTSGVTIQLKPGEHVVCTFKNSKLIEVPNVIGLHRCAAKDTLIKAGFDVETEYLATDSAPFGEVVSQNPEGGSFARGGSTVKMGVSSGQPQVDVLVEGNSTGIFMNPIGPSGMVFSGIETNSFTWGDQGSYGTGPSSLNFVGQPFSIKTEKEFLIGTLSYFNGTIVSDTQADSVDLKLTLEFGNPEGVTNEFKFAMQLINTQNIVGSPPEDQADIVFLPNTLADTTIKINGVDHTLKLVFSEVTSGGFSGVDRLFAFEGQTAIAQLRGIITANVQQDISDIPVANAGPDQKVIEGDPVMLDSSASFGETLEFNWEQISGPEVPLDLTDPSHPTFTAPSITLNSETLRFKLVVSDLCGVSEPDFVDIIVKRRDIGPFDGRAEKESVIDELNNYLPTTDKHDDKRIEKAVDHLSKSLNDSYWENEFLLTDKGAKVFYEERKAIHELEKVKSLDVSAAVNSLLTIDETLAQVSIDMAKETAIENECHTETNGNHECEKALTEIEKAEKEMAKAQEELYHAKKDGTPDPKYYKVIDHYKKAWQHAQKAMKKLSALEYEAKQLSMPFVASPRGSIIVGFASWKRAWSSGRTLSRAAKFDMAMPIS